VNQLEQYGKARIGLGQTTYAIGEFLLEAFSLTQSKARQLRKAGGGN
jgi:hypothetical protein